MTKLISLKQNKDFRRVYHRGKSAVTPTVVVYCAKNRCRYNRLGITVSKKIGCAVVRNRAKRLIRVAYSAVIDSVDNEKCFYDFVIVARSKCAESKSQTVTNQIFGALKKLRITGDE